VNSGVIIDSTKFRDSSLYKSPWDIYLKSIFDAGYSTIQPSDIDNIHHSHHPTARYTNATRLAVILRKVAIHVLQSGKKLIITGHSLGGALSTILTFDVIMNYMTFEKKATRLGKYTTYKKMNQNVLKRLYLYTYGEVEYGDEFLISCLKSHPSIQKFIQTGNYQRFVSLTTSPLCKSDVVTRIATKVLTNIPDVLSGKGGGRIERKKQKEQKKTTTRNTTKSNKSKKKGILSKFANKLKNIEEEHIDGDLMHVVPATYLCSGYAANTIDAHSLVHYMRGLAHLARGESNQRSKSSFHLIHDLPYSVSQYLGLTKGGACYNNSRSPIFYSYDC
jgi:hypothetical protein